VFRWKEECLIISVEVELERIGMNGIVLLPLDLFHPFGHSLYCSHVLFEQAEVLCGCKWAGLH